MLQELLEEQDGDGQAISLASETTGGPINSYTLASLGQKKKKGKPCTRSQEISGFKK